MHCGFASAGTPHREPGLLAIEPPRSFPAPRWPCPGFAPTTLTGLSASRTAVSGRPAAVLRLRAGRATCAVPTAPRLRHSHCTLAAASLQPHRPCKPGPISAPATPRLYTRCAWRCGHACDAWLRWPCWNPVLAAPRLSPAAPHAPFLPRPGSVPCQVHQVRSILVWPAMPGLRAVRAEGQRWPLHARHSDSTWASRWPCLLSAMLRAGHTTGLTLRAGCTAPPCRPRCGRQSFASAAVSNGPARQDQLQRSLCVRALGDTRLPELQPSPPCGRCDQQSLAAGGASDR